MRCEADSAPVDVRCSSYGGGGVAKMMSSARYIIINFVSPAQRQVNIVYFRARAVYPLASSPFIKNVYRRLVAVSTAAERERCGCVTRRRVHYLQRGRARAHLLQPIER